MLTPKTDFLGTGPKLLIVTKLLRLSIIAFVKANRADLDNMSYSVESHLGVLVCQ